MRDIDCSFVVSMESAQRLSKIDRPLTAEKIAARAKDPYEMFRDTQTIEINTPEQGAVKMGWHYVAVRHEHDGEVIYKLHEEFPDIQEGAERVRTVNPTAVMGDSPAELAKWLRHAAEDVEKYAPIEDA